MLCVMYVLVWYVCMYVYYMCMYGVHVYVWCLCVCVCQRAPFTVGDAAPEMVALSAKRNQVEQAIQNKPVSITAPWFLAVPTVPPSQHLSHASVPQSGPADWITAKLITAACVPRCVCGTCVCACVVSVCVHVWCVYACVVCICMCNVCVCGVHGGLTEKEEDLRK